MILGAIFLTFLSLLAQHEGHGPAPPATDVPPCVEEALALVESASERLETARQSNQPSAMRAAMEDLQTTLDAVKAELASCSEPEG